MHRSVEDESALNEAIEMLVTNLTQRCANNTQSTLTTSNNVFSLLNDYWRLRGDKQHQQQPIVYEYLERAEPPHVCFVTLPCGSCFATHEPHSRSKQEARKSAATIALMNSMLNDHPMRHINDEFIRNATLNATAAADTTKCPLSVQLYERLLSLCAGKTVLDFKRMMSTFQLLQWNGSLRAMRERQCSLDEVLAAYKDFAMGEAARAQMSLDWIAREQQAPGTLRAQLDAVNGEIEAARVRGLEMRFLKEKRDILLLASYQYDIEIDTCSLLK